VLTVSSVDERIAKLEEKMADLDLREASTEAGATAN
jgi:hypothetical protein